MSWPFETSDAYVVPERVSEIQRARSGLTPEEWRLPPILVATFQREAYGRLLERVSAQTEPPGNVQLGPSLESAMGVVDGTPVTIARIGIGAPAAAIVLEVSIARGVRNILVVGSAGSLQSHLTLGSTVVVEGRSGRMGHRTTTCPPARWLPPMSHSAPRWPIRRRLAVRRRCGGGRGPSTRRTGRRSVPYGATGRRASPWSRWRLRRCSPWRAFAASVPG